jgi:hypothetical protein
MNRVRQGAQDVEDGFHLRGEDGLLSIGEEGAEQRGAQQDTGHHLAEHARLFHPQGQAAADGGRGEDDHDGGQDPQDEFEVLVGGGCQEGGGGHGGLLCSSATCGEVRR